MTEAWKSFAKVGPFDGMTAANPGVVLNLVSGEWVASPDVRDDIVDPLNDDPFLTVPDTKDVTPYVDGLASCSYPNFATIISIC